MKRGVVMTFCRVFLLVVVLSTCPSISSVNGESTTGSSTSSSDSRGDDDGTTFLIGTGIYDITGPAAQINFIGYASTTQNGHGIHMRLRSRAYIMAESSIIAAAEDDVVPPRTAEAAAASRKEDLESVQPIERLNLLRWNRHKSDNPQQHREFSEEAALANPETAVCFVSADIGMGSDLLNMKVVKRLEELLPKQKSSGKALCHLENLSISATHTHSAPGGFLQYVLYQITSLGYSEEVMDAYVEGIAQSILRAYKNLQKGSISMTEDFLFDANINRSPSSYLLNPPEERERYEAEGNTDKRMLQLRFTTETNSSDIGVLNWFAVHGTSMNKSSLLVSGDNKGYSSYLMEKHYNGNDTLPGHGNFVAAFASTNLGDVSPNINGAVCIDTGLPCDIITSSCNGRAAMCQASGPGKDMFESTEIIGRRQFELAVAMMEDKTEARPLQAKVSFRHAFVNMANLTVMLADGKRVRTCPAALGYSFASGTTDGPGDFDFTQGRNSSNPFWDMMGGFLSHPTEAQIQCQDPKPILLNTGEVTEPYLWDPNSVPISVFRVGDLFILNVPAELTTMSGRRLRRAIEDVAARKGDVRSPVVTIAGLSNSYAHYVTTFQEYGGQRYEAASTLYGPHTLSAYIQEFERITNDLLDDAPSHTADPPRDLSQEQISLIPPVVFDTIAVGKKFGSIAKAATDEYASGVDTVFVSFRSANPRNNQRIEGTFLTVDRLLDDGSWKTIYVDGDWCTKFHWNSKESYLGISYAEIEWEIPPQTPQGLYRICHFGARKRFLSEAEAAVLLAPDWMTSNSFGSAFAGLVVAALKLSVSLSKKIRSHLLLGKGNRTVEFSGCSKSFLVKDSSSSSSSSSTTTTTTIPTP